MIGNYQLLLGIFLKNIHLIISVFRRLTSWRTWRPFGCSPGWCPSTAATWRRPRSSTTPSTSSSPSTRSSRLAIGNRSTWPRSGPTSRWTPTRRRSSTRSARPRCARQRTRCARRPRSCSVRSWRPKSAAANPSHRWEAWAAAATAARAATTPAPWRAHPPSRRSPPTTPP